jgi:small subunit ribosomal protein S16
MQRVGRKHEPVFRLVLTDSKNGPKSGKFLEILGSYDSRRGDQAELNADKVKYWVSKGAQLSDTANNLLVKKKLIDGKKISVIPKKIIEEARKSKEEAKAEVEKVETPDVKNEEVEKVTEDEVPAEVTAEVQQVEAGEPKSE